VGVSVSVGLRAIAMHDNRQTNVCHHNSPANGAVSVFNRNHILLDGSGDECAG
jgi:hypothetical protein